MAQLYIAWCSLIYYSLPLGHIVPGRCLYIYGLCFFPSQPSRGEFLLDLPIFISLLVFTGYYFTFPLNCLFQCDWCLHSLHSLTFCPFVSLEQRALALALFHISQLNNGMRYQTVLEQVTLQSLKGTFRE